MNKCYVFRRLSGFGAGNLSSGHVGWAFQLGDGTVICGATENPSGNFNQPSTAKGAWCERYNENDLLRAFTQVRHFTDAHRNSVGQSLPYDHYKVLASEAPNPDNAYAKAVWCSKQDFRGTGIPRGRNCLDDTFDILEAYGKRGLHWPSDPRYCSPNLWFDSLSEQSIRMPRFDMSQQERLALPEASADLVCAPQWAVSAA
ncbi:MAG: hypothetical protein WA191_26330 [Telluria sp.]|nr:hypothetical protein [Telluria sp.]